MKNVIFILLIFICFHGASFAQIIGNNAEGTLIDTPYNAMSVIRYQCTQNMAIDKMYVKIATSGSGYIKCAVYSDNNGVPDTFLMGTNELTNPGTGWKSFNLTSSLSLTSGTWYHFVLWTNDSGYQIYYTANGVGTPWRSLTYGSWPSFFGTATPWTGGTYCIYAQAPTSPNVSTTSVSNITQTTASSGGNVTADGGASVTARGVCWSTSSNPTTANSKTTDGTGTGTFASSITGLSQNTTYHVRAYATNSAGTSYGSDVQFTTLNTPTVSTTSVSNIAQTTASSGGNVTADGGASVTARGVCWSTSSNPTTANSKTTDGTGTGTFSSSITGLSSNTAYHVRAYATNSAGTSYGSDVLFTTTSAPIAPVGWWKMDETSGTIAPDASGNGHNGTLTNGPTWVTGHTNNAINFDGANDYIVVNNVGVNTTGGQFNTVVFWMYWNGTNAQIPFAWSGNNYCVCLYNSHFGVNTGNGDILGISSTGLSNTWVHVAVVFPNATPSISNTKIYINSALQTLTLWGTPDGSKSATTTVYMGSRNGTYAYFGGKLDEVSIYNSELSAAQISTLYNSSGTPTITTTSVGNITQTTASAGGNVTADGGASVTARGVCWSTSSNPTTANSTTTDGTGTGAFTSSITGLSSNTTYHVRAYATNSAGTSYGSDIQFATLNAAIANYYVSPSGNDNNNGDINHPFYSLNKVWTVISAGDLVYMRGGTYAYDTQQVLTGKNGTAGNLIKIWAYPGETPNITKSGNYTTNAGIFFKGNYVHFKGLEISGYTQITSGNCSGIRVENSNYNIFELLNIHHNGLGMDMPNLGYTEHATGNLILNCDFHHNQDPLTNGDPYGNGDGISLEWITHPEDINTIKGCRSWYNSDDGYDFYKNEGTVIIDSCQAFLNGYIPDTSTTGGDGNGFKLGPTVSGYPSEIKRIFTNTVSFQNRMNGYDLNGGRFRAVFYNNTSYLNGNRGFRMADDAYNESLSHIAKNNIGYQNSSLNGDFSPNSIISNNTFLTDGSGNPNYTVSNSDFLSLNSSSMNSSRQANGSLPDVSFLHLDLSSDLVGGGVDVGLPYLGYHPDLGAYETLDQTKSATIVDDLTANPDLAELKDIFIVYPNPVKDKLTIAIKEKVKQVTLKLYDSKGNKLYECFGNGEIILDMSSYASGLYILQVGIAGELKVVKVAK